MSIDLKSIVSKQLPEFAREDYPLFTAFVEAYYEYMDKRSFDGASGATYPGGNQQRNLEDLRDLDKTVDEYIQFFKNELDVFGDKYEFIEQKLLLRKVKELFISKGVESSYKFLLKILFNKNAEISYPWDSVLKVSDGKWKQDMSIFVDITSGDVDKLPGNRINILGPNIIIKVYVDRVRYIRDNIYEIFINKNYYGNIKIDYTISYSGITGTILPTTSTYYIENPGRGYRVGQLITADTISNGKTITQLFKVSKVNSTGGIVNIIMVKYGCGYDAGFYVLKTIGTVTATSSISIDKESINQYILSNDTAVDQYKDYGYIIKPTYYDISGSTGVYVGATGATGVGFGEPTYVGEPINTFYQESISGQGLAPYYLLIRFDLGAVAKYQGYYSSNDGFLNDDIFIQDSYRWQKYSYLVTVDESLSKYKALLKSYLHPAGTALFGEYQIQNTYNVGIVGTIELGQWQSKATFNTINKSISNDYVYPGATGTGGRILIEPYANDDYFVYTDQYNPPETYTFTG
jgi:hypothetical protein